MIVPVYGFPGSAGRLIGHADAVVNADCKMLHCGRQIYSPDFLFVGTQRYAVARGAELTSRGGDCPAVAFTEGIHRGDGYFLRRVDICRERYFHFVAVLHGGCKNQVAPFGIPDEEAEFAVREAERQVACGVGHADLDFRIPVAEEDVRPGKRYRITAEVKRCLLHLIAAEYDLRCKGSRFDVDHIVLNKRKCQQTAALVEQLFSDHEVGAQGASCRRDELSRFGVADRDLAGNLASVRIVDVYIGCRYHQAVADNGGVLRKIYHRRCILACRRFRRRAVENLQRDFAVLKGGGVKRKYILCLRRFRFGDRRGGIQHRAVRFAGDQCCVLGK